MAAVVVALDDARLRIVPALADGQAAGELEGALQALGAALAEGDVSALDALVRRARGALDEYRSPPDAAEAEGPELDAIRLAVEQAATLALPDPEATNEGD